MIWQRRREINQSMKALFKKCGQYYRNIKRKRHLKRNTTNVLEIQQADQENLSVVKDNYTEKLYQKHLAVLQANQQAGIRNHVKSESSASFELSSY